MQRDRAYRRHQYIRAKKRAIRFLHLAGLSATENQIHLYATDRKPCSCYWCSGEKYRDERHKYNIGTEANG